MFEDIFSEESVKDIQAELVDIAKDIQFYRDSILEGITKAEDQKEMLAEAEMLLKKYEALHSDVENLEIQNITLPELSEDVNQLKIDRDEMRRHLKYCQVVDTFIEECFTGEKGVLVSRLKMLKEILLKYRAKNSDEKNKQLLEECETSYTKHVMNRFELKNVQIKVVDVEVKP